MADPPGDFWARAKRRSPSKLKSATFASSSGARGNSRQNQAVGMKTGFPEGDKLEVAVKTGRWFRRRRGGRAGALLLPDRVSDAVTGPCNGVALRRHQPTSTSFETTPLGTMGKREPQIIPQKRRARHSPRAWVRGEFTAKSKSRTRRRREPNRSTSPPSLLESGSGTHQPR